MAEWLKATDFDSVLSQVRILLPLPNKTEAEDRLRRGSVYGYKIDLIILGLIFIRKESER